MIFECHKCHAHLSTRQNLETHLNRKNPCDRKCPECDYKGSNARQLKKHMKKHEAMPIAEPIIEEPMEIEPVVVAPIITKRKQRFIVVPPPPMFPLDDYDWEGLVAVDEETESAEQTTELNSDETLVEKLTKTTTVKYERVLIRAKNLQARMKLKSILMSLKGLDYESNLAELVKQLMYNVHAQPDQPEFHTICNTDVNRGNVSTYNRVADTERCRWISYNPVQAPTILNDHGRNLLKFLIQAGINMLELKFWVTLRKVVMYTKDDQNSGNDIYVIVVYFDDDVKQVRMERNRKYDCKDFVTCPGEFHEEASSLIKHVEERKQEIILALNDTSLKADELNTFLNYSRPICIKSIMK